MKNIIKLVNNERKSIHISTLKACTTYDHGQCSGSATDHCYKADTEECTNGAHDVCRYDYDSCSFYNNDDCDVDYCMAFDI